MARRLVIAIAVVVGFALTVAHAQNDPWCAYLTGGTPNCAFATFAECIKAIQGKTGICDRNPEYTAPTEADSASPSTAMPNPAATGTIGSERGQARQHQLHHRGAHHFRSKTIKTPSGRRHRFKPHPNRRH